MKGRIFSTRYYSPTAGSGSERRFLPSIQTIGEDDLWGSAATRVESGPPEMRVQSNGTSRNRAREERYIDNGPAQHFKRVGWRLTEATARTRQWVE